MLTVNRLIKLCLKKKKLPEAHAKNLGVYIDSDLNFQHHIKNTVKMCNYFIRDIRRVRKHLFFLKFVYCIENIYKGIIVYSNSDIIIDTIVYMFLTIYLVFVFFLITNKKNKKQNTKKTTKRKNSLEK